MSLQRPGPEGVDSPTSTPRSQAGTTEHWPPLSSLENSGLLMEPCWKPRQGPPPPQSGARTRCSRFQEWADCMVLRPDSRRQVAFPLGSRTPSTALQTLAVRKTNTYVVVPRRPAGVQLHVKLSLLPGQLVVLRLLLSGQCVPLEGTQRQGEAGKRHKLPCGRGYEVGLPCRGLARTAALGQNLLCQLPHGLALREEDGGGCGEGHSGRASTEATAEVST